ncbi:DUF2512 family protein [Cohnella rhizosphaerae]|uniref:YndM family protein n=1 Tax=Cohnella rhizosphaerae TaxID=1457232 RepID=A0A9X4L2W7_9BACL|nr:DUF2512 family protein [Cohnella rhizosphaerae]MDG0812634.1 YndM family protein [Cohnella rhizosphaerae]
MKFLLKWLVNGTIATTLLMYYSNASFLGSVTTATILTIIAYMVVDQIILRSTNNLIATVSDGILGYLVLWVAASTMKWTISPGEIFIVALITGIAEFFYSPLCFSGRIVIPTPARLIAAGIPKRPRARR